MIRYKDKQRVKEKIRDARYQRERKQKDKAKGKGQRIRKVCY